MLRLQSKKVTRDNFQKYGQVRYGGYVGKAADCRKQPWTSADVHCKVLSRSEYLWEFNKKLKCSYMFEEFINGMQGTSHADVMVS